MEVKYLGVSKDTKDIFRELTGKFAEEIPSDKELFELVLKNPEKVVMTRYKMEMTEIQGCAAYATMFAEVLNELKNPDHHELAYAIMGMQIAVRALRKQLPPVIKNKINDLDSLCKKNLSSTVVLKTGEKDA